MCDDNKYMYNYKMRKERNGKIGEWGNEEERAE